MITRRAFLVRYVGVLSLMALPAWAKNKHAKQLTVSVKARAGESVGDLLARSRYQVRVAEEHTEFVTWMRDRSGQWIAGPWWVPPIENPDAKPPKGFPCIKLQIRPIGQGWSEPTDFAIMKQVLSQGERVRFVEVGYDPALVF